MAISSSSGQVSLEWILNKSLDDPLILNMRAFFLSGSRIKPNVQCQAAHCCLPSRIPGHLDHTTLVEGFNPMVFCYTCDRLFHVACCGLIESTVLKSEAPWRCGDCTTSIKNSHASRYYQESKYAVPMLKRREKFIRENFCPENGSNQVDTTIDYVFDEHDRASFSRTNNANQTAIIQDQSTREKKQDCIDSDQHTAATTIPKNRMTIEDQLAAEQKKNQALESRMKELENRLVSLTLPSKSTQQTSLRPPVEKRPLLSSTGIHGNNNNVLTSFYTSGNREARSESLYSTASIIQRPELPRTADNSSWNHTTGNSDISHLLSRLTSAQERTEERHLLEMRRKAAPKFSEFDGNPSKWLTFLEDIDRYRNNCQYDDDTVKFYMRGALKGEAYKLVRDILQTQCLDVILEVLKSAFGDEMTLINESAEEIKKIHLSSHLQKSEVVKCLSAIQAYFSSCNYVDQSYMEENFISAHIQPPVDKQHVDQSNKIQASAKQNQVNKSSVDKAEKMALLLEIDRVTGIGEPAPSTSKTNAEKQPKTDDSTNTALSSYSSSTASLCDFEEFILGDE